MSSGEFITCPRMDYKTIAFFISCLVLANLIEPTYQHGHGYNYGGSSSGSFSSSSSAAYSSSSSGAVAVDDGLIKDIAQGIKGIINSAKGYGGGSSSGAYAGSASGAYGGAYSGGQGGQYGSTGGQRTGSGTGGYANTYGGRKITHNTGNYGDYDNVYVATIDDNAYGGITPEGKPGYGSKKPTVIVVTSIGTDADTGAGVLVPQPGKGNLPAPGGSIHDSKPSYGTPGYTGTGPKNLPGPPGSIHDSKPAHAVSSAKAGQMHYSGPFPGPPGSIHDSKPAGQHPRPNYGQSGQPGYNVPACNKSGGGCTSYGSAPTGNSGFPGQNIPNCNIPGGCQNGNNVARPGPNYNVPPCNKQGGCNPPTSGQYPTVGPVPSPQYPYTSKPAIPQPAPECPPGGCKPINSYVPPPSGIPPGFPQYPSRCTEIACFLEGKKPPTTNPDIPPELSQKPTYPDNDYGSKPVNSKPNPYQPTGSGTCTGGACADTPTNDYGSKPCSTCESATGGISSGSSQDSKHGNYGNSDFVFIDKDNDQTGGSLGFAGGFGGASAGSGGKSLSSGGGSYGGQQSGAYGGSKSGAFAGSFASASASAHASASHY